MRWPCYCRNYQEMSINCNQKQYLEAMSLHTTSQVLLSTVAEIFSELFLIVIYMMAKRLIFELNQLLYSKLKTSKLIQITFIVTKIIIRSIFSSFHRPRAPTWPANNCLQIMFCSCVMSSFFVLLQMIFCPLVISCNDALMWKMADHFPELSESYLNWNIRCEQMVLKQLLNSVVTKYRDLSLSHRSIICQRIINPLSNDKSRYF